MDEAAVLLANDLLLEDADDGRQSLRGKGAVMWQGNANWARDELLEQQRYSATRDFGLVSEHADIIIEALGFDLPRGSDEYAVLCDKLNAVRMSVPRDK